MNDTKKHISNICFFFFSPHTFFVSFCSATVTTVCWLTCLNGANVNGLLVLNIINIAYLLANRSIGLNGSVRNLFLHERDACWINLY